MNRVLRIELRRSAALGTALVLLTVGTLLLYLVDGILFADGWVQLAMTQRWYLALLVPLALTAGAWQSRREHRSHVAELFAGTPRPRAQRVAPTAAAMAIGVTGGYLAMGLAGGIRIATTARYVPLTVLAVTAVGVLALIAAVWVGEAAGRLLPSPVTAPAIGVAGLAVLLFIPWATRPRGWLATVFSPIYGMNLPGPYATVPTRVGLAQACWTIGLATAAFLLFAGAGRRTRAAALIPVLAGAGLAVAVMPHQDRAVYDAVDTRARALVCTTDGPRVCVSRVHTGLLTEVAAPARDGLAALARLPRPPAEVHEDTTVYPGDGQPAWRPDVILLSVLAGPDGHLGPATDTAAVVTAAFTSPPGCDRSADPADQVAAAFWLLGREPVAPRRSSPLDLGGSPPDVYADATQRWQALSRLPAAEATSRIAALRRAAATCTAGKPMLTGGPA